MSSSLVAWSDHKAFLLRALRDIFESGKQSDLEIKCHDKVFKVHKFVMNIFTDYFKDFDGLWVRIDVNPVYMLNVLKFIYLGQVVIDYDQMEGFLQTCKFLQLKLFKDPDINAEGMREKDADKEESNHHFQERYELNDFQLICRNCYKCFSTEKVLKKHLWACNRAKTFKCRYCEVMFRHKNDLENHERTHTGETPFKCPYENCDKKFKYRSSMVLHKQAEHEGVRHKCEFCEKEYKSTMGLKSHMQVYHSNDRPFSCMSCGKSFASQTQRSTHYKITHLKKIPSSMIRYREKLKRAKIKQKASSSNAEGESIGKETESMDDKDEIVNNEQEVSEAFE